MAPLLLPALIQIHSKNQQAEQESVDKTVGEGNAEKAATITKEASTIKETPSTLHWDSRFCQQAPSH